MNEHQEERREEEELERAPQAQAQHEAGAGEDIHAFIRAIVHQEVTAQAEARQAREDQDAGDGGDPQTQSLALQALWLQKAAGVDMLELLRGDSRLMDRVAAGDMDLYQAYIQHHLDAPGPGALPPPIRGGSARARVDVGRLSAEKMRELEQRLGRGERIAID